MTVLNFKTTIDEIRELTQCNDHTSAYILGAELVGAGVLTEKLKLFKKMKDLSVYLDDSMSQFQYALYNELMDFSTDVLDDDQQDIFYQSF